MSLVAGCSLLNGVLLAADTRITWKWRDGRVEHADVAQKLFVVAPGTAIGYVSNDIVLKSMLLRELLRQAARDAEVGRDHAPQRASALLTVHSEPVVMR